MRGAFAVLALTTLACGGLAGPPPPDPMLDPIRGIYAGYTGGDPRAAPWLAVASADLQQKWTWAVGEAEDACGVPPIFEVDPLLDGRDVHPGPVTVAGSASGDKGTATATFEAGGKPREVRFDLVREQGAWRIDDIHPSGSSLRQRIQATVVAGDCPPP